MSNHKLSVGTGLILIFIYGCHSAPLETMEMNELPEDVIRFQHFLEDFEHGEINLLPSMQLFRGKFPLKFEHVPHSQHREKREIPEPNEPGMINHGTGAIDEDAVIRHYVRNEITRIFSCYQRLRCGYTKAQAEEECKWLEHSSLYHQLMKILGIKNYPKKPQSLSPQGPLAQNHVHNGQYHQRQRSVVVPNPQMQIQSDVSINPIHQNLQNGIRYGSRPGQYLNTNSNANRNRRAYDSFYTEQQLAPISQSSR